MATKKKSPTEKANRAAKNDALGERLLAEINEGRPLEFSQKLADVICLHIADGKSLRSICRMDGMPSIATVYGWHRAFPEFLKQYAQAKDDCADAMAEDIIDIADNEVEQPLLVDGLPVTGTDGKLVMVRDNVSVQHAKLRTDNRKWIAARLKPKKYGDRVENTLNAGDGFAAFFEAIKPTVGPPSKRDAD